METASRLTCGALQQRLWETFLTGSLMEAAPDIAYGTFAVGFMAGQAEKVLLGACKAFMIRPAPDWWAWAKEAMMLVCAHYGMNLYISRDEGELWGCGNFSVLQHVHATLKCEEKNSPGWHQLRGILCGIPASALDQEYHQREGYEQRCEPESWTTGEQS